MSKSRYHTKLIYPESDRSLVVIFNKLLTDKKIQTREGIQKMRISLFGYTDSSFLYGFINIIIITYFFLIRKLQFMGIVF